MILINKIPITSGRVEVLLQTGTESHLDTLAKSMHLREVLKHIYQLQLHVKSPLLKDASRYDLCWTRANVSAICSPEILSILERK